MHIGNTLCRKPYRDGEFAQIWIVLRRHTAPRDDDVVTACKSSLPSLGVRLPRCPTRSSERPPRAGAPSLVIYRVATQVRSQPQRGFRCLAPWLEPGVTHPTRMLRPSNRRATLHY